MRRAQRIVALWPGAADSICEQYGVPANRIDVIPNARAAGDSVVAGEAERTAARRALGLPAEGLVVGCVGSISAEKRVGLAVEAVAELDDAVPARRRGRTGSAGGRRAWRAAHARRASDLHRSARVRRARCMRPSTSCCSPAQPRDARCDDRGRSEWCASGCSRRRCRSLAVRQRCGWRSSCRRTPRPQQYSEAVVRAVNATDRRHHRPVWMSAPGLRSSSNGQPSVRSSTLHTEPERPQRESALGRMARRISPRHRRWQRLLDSCTIDPDALPKPLESPGPAGRDDLRPFEVGYGARDRSAVAAACDGDRDGAVGLLPSRARRSVPIVSHGDGEHRDAHSRSPGHRRPGAATSRAMAARR